MPGYQPPNVTIALAVPSSSNTCKLLFMENIDWKMNIVQTIPYFAWLLRYYAAESTHESTMFASRCQICSTTSWNITMDGYSIKNILQRCRTNAPIVFVHAEATEIASAVGVVSFDASIMRRNGIRMLQQSSQAMRLRAW